MALQRVGTRLYIYYRNDPDRISSSRVISKPVLLNCHVYASRIASHRLSLWTSCGILFQKLGNSGKKFIERCTGDGSIHRIEYRLSCRLALDNLSRGTEGRPTRCHCKGRDSWDLGIQDDLVRGQRSCCWGIIYIRGCEKKAPIANAIVGQGFHGIKKILTKAVKARTLF